MLHLAWTGRTPRQPVKEGGGIPPKVAMGRREKKVRVARRSGRQTRRLWRRQKLERAHKGVKRQKLEAEQWDVLVFNCYLAEQYNITCIQLLPG